MSTCPNCGARSEGNFCATCGTPLARKSCPSCGSDAPAGARFCTSCGASLQGKVGGGGGGEQIPWSAMGWWAAGGLMLVLILLLVFPIINPDESTTSSPGSQAAPFAGEGTGAPPDISQMTPREAADRLFNRVMTAAEAGDSGQVAMFMPMALQSYEAARPLDADGLFHLSLLQRTGGDYEAALAVAQEALEEEPDHLLLLGAAGAAAQELGETEGARGYYERFLEVYDEERDRDRSGYRDHQQLLPDMRDAALAATGRGGG